MALGTPNRGDLAGGRMLGSHKVVNDEGMQPLIEGTLQRQHAWPIALWGRDLTF